MARNWFERQSHLGSVQESYGGHLLEAWRISLMCLVASLAAFLHGLFPFLLGSTATRLISKVLERHAQRLSR
jgi:uncharacterized protein YjeT (DUF2065 family)